MEYITCTTCGLQNKRSDDFTLESMNGHLAASKEYFWPKKYSNLDFS